MDLWADVAAQYADFAHYAEDSPCFHAWSLAVAEDPDVLAWLGALPPVKQHPNLVFAAARWHGVAAPGPYAGLREALLGDAGAIRSTILARATQTNEVGRLATLTPFLTEIATQAGRPLALLEVGASAGLCLYPDRWSYRWVTDDGPVAAGNGPRLDCHVAGPLPATGTPTVAWRGGIDLNPLDVTDADAMAWLATLVWPEQDERRARLLTAVEVARPDPPRLVTGDLLDALPDLVNEASAYGEVVVFHTAVIAGRCRWVSNESPAVLPRVAATSTTEPPPGRFVLGVDG